jgi:hypothetical protein
MAVKAITVLGLALASLGLIQPEHTLAQEVEEPTGLVVSVSGDVVILQAEGARVASEGSILQMGDTLVVRVGGACRGFSPAGGSFDLQGPAQMVTSDTAQEDLLGSISTWVRKQLAQWVGEARRQPLTTRTARDWKIEVPSPQPLIPAPGRQVRGTEARFLWTLIPGVDRYVLTLATVSGEESSRTVRGHGTVVEDLIPGEHYVWKIRPELEDWQGGAGWRTFRVMTPEEEQQLELALRGLSGVEAGTLLLATGLYEDAIRRFDAAISADDCAHSAKVWRAEALAEIGLHGQAYADLIAVRGQE